MKKRLLTLLAVIIGLTSTTVLAASYVKDNFSLALGQSNTSGYAKLEEWYPFVQYEGHNTDESTYSVTLTRKKLIGTENIETKSNNTISGSEVKRVYFNKTTTNKDYRVTTKVTKTSGYFNAYYILTSSNTPNP